MGIMRIGILLCLLAVGVAGGGAAAAQEAAADPAATTTVSAVVYWCESVDCADEPDGQKNVMVGATVTSFRADGSELDRCTIAEGGLQCELTVPAAEDGTYAVAPAEGFDSYTLVSAVPEVTGEGPAVGREWTFVPGGGEAATATMTVNACTDATCTDATLMDGATVTAYAASGEVVDACTIDIRDGQADYLGCGLTLPGAGGWFEIAPGPGYETYHLATTDPEIIESETRGTLYIWWFVPAAAEETPTPAPTTPATTPVPTVPGQPTPATTAAPSLPNTGSGPAAAPAMPSALVLAGIGFAAALAGGMTLALRRR